MERSSKKSPGPTLLVINVSSAFPGIAEGLAAASAFASLKVSREEGERVELSLPQVRLCHCARTPSAKAGNSWGPNRVKKGDYLKRRVHLP
jgi:hypothetical protein